MANQDASNPSHVVFDLFAHAQSCKDVQRHFAELCQHLELDPRDYSSFYTKIKERLNYWKAKALWVKLDKRASHPDYQQGKACAKNTCLVLGAGPCGLRTAIELALLGAHVVVLEKRETFARNNVLHLWPYTIYDLRSLSAKKFYGKFCTGALDHISIRQLQLILLKVALLLGVEVNTGVEYRGLLDPSDDTGWRAKIHPESHPAGKLQFDVFISAGGGRFVPDGFRRKELRGKLAIGITANFINRRTAAETQVAEISGVARIYNQKFFHDLLTETGIDLENIVYYKDDTHYFVMTAKKKSLLQKGVIKQDFSDAEQLLAPENVDQEALLDYAQDAAHFSTGCRLPDLEFATHGGRPDVAMFDFTCMHRAENASLVRERRGKKLLMGLVGDCLVEPFWPLGTGVARGFLASFDAAWMVRSWGLGVPVLKVLAQRESVYQLLSQTTPENTIKNYSGYSINPTTRYRHVNLSSIQPNQVQHLYYVEDDIDFNRPSKKLKSRWSYMPQDSTGGFDELLSWCQQNTVGYEKAKVTDLTQSWRSGLALCALIHHFKPHLIDISSLTESNAIHNNQLAFSILEMELGIPPVMSASDMATRGQIDKLSMVLYLTQVHDAFTQRTPTTEPAGLLTPAKTVSFARTQAAVIFLNTLKRNSLQRLKKKRAAEQEAKEIKMSLGEEEHPVAPELRPADPEPDPGPDVTAGPVQASSEECYFCRQRVYVLERISTEGKFFHRSCFTCHQCGATLRLGDYTFRQDNGHFYCELHSRDPELENGRRMSSSLDTRGESQEEDDDEEEENDHTLCPSDDDYYEHTLDSGPSVPFGKPKELDDILPEPTDKPSQPPPGPALERGLEPAEEQGVPSQPTPVPAPRLSWQGTPTQTPPHSPPVPKPRSVLPANPNTPDGPPSDTGSSTATPDSRPKQSLRKLKLSDEEKTQLVNLSFSQDSDSETQGGSSSCSSSSATASGPSPPKPAALGPDGQEEEGYWSGGAGMPRRDRRNRHCFRRKEGPGRQNQPTKVRSKFSPWNLSSPRLGREHRLSVHNSHPGRVETTFRHTSQISEDGADGDDDDDGDDDNDDAYEDEEDMFKKNDQFEAITPAEVEKLELMKMKTLERRAKMSELQRFRKAQSIQRRLEEIEVTFKDLEEKGVELERALRGEAGNGGSPDMIGHWIQLVHQKNALVSEESDLMVASKQLELEDRQSMLEMEVRKHMNLSDSEKTEEQRVDEARAMQQMIETVDMRNSLVAFLEEKRLKELSDEEHVVTLMEAKRHSTAGAQVHWA